MPDTKLEFKRQYLKKKENPPTGSLKENKKQICLQTQSWTCVLLCVSNYMIFHWRLFVCLHYKPNIRRCKQYWGIKHRSVTKPCPLSFLNKNQSFQDTRALNLLQVTSLCSSWGFGSHKRSSTSTVNILQKLLHVYSSSSSSSSAVSLSVRA